MSRLERFREIRNNRRKIFFLFLLSFLLLGTGICIVDYTTNFLMRNEKGIKIISFNKKETGIEIKLMNRLLWFDTSKLKNDFDYIRGYR